MQAPKCKLCGATHFSTQHCETRGSANYARGDDPGKLIARSAVSHSTGDPRKRPRPNQAAIETARATVVSERVNKAFDEKKIDPATLVVHADLPPRSEGTPVHKMHKMSLRMEEEEWEMLDRARGALSRNDMIRVLVRDIDRITG